MRYVGETVGAGPPAACSAACSAGRGRSRRVAAAARRARSSSAWPRPAGDAAGRLGAGRASSPALTILHTVPTAVLVGLQRFRQASAVGLTTGFFSTIATALVLWAGGGITGMFAVELVAAIANLVWTGTLARRALGPGDRGATRGGAGTSAARRATTRSSRRSACCSTTIVASRVGVLLPERVLDDGAIALYSIAFSMVVALRLVPSALGGTVAPAFATLFGAGQHDRIRSGFRARVPARLRRSRCRWRRPPSRSARSSCDVVYGASTPASPSRCGSCCSPSRSPPSARSRERTSPGSAGCG